jgi:two-component system chemotaxis response regulator CheB
LVKRDIVVIGASAGGIEALRELTAELPHQIDAALFVVVHMPSWWDSKLPSVLSRQGGIAAVRAQADQTIEPGRIYVAPPDHHLLLNDGRVHLWRGPKENLHRPAINALFRSAAAAYGERVIGVILSGSMDDGSTGLWWVKRYGGLAIVQDPREALHPDMPRNALQHVTVDYVLGAREIGKSLGGMVQGVGLEAIEKP